MVWNYPLTFDCREPFCVGVMSPLSDRLFPFPCPCLDLSFEGREKDWLSTLFLVGCKVLSCSLAAAESLQSCPTLCNPLDAAHQAPLSLGFSRQDHWSGLPFPSPMHESEKGK